ncbi:hypothetical protein Tco_1087052 [Tanacetum coccineum]
MDRIISQITQIVKPPPSTSQPQVKVDEIERCKSFLEIQTVNKKLFPIFRATCEALGLLCDDKEWETALEEALIMEEVLEQMADDILIRVSNLLSIQNIHINNLEGCVLYKLEVILNGSSKSVTDFGLSPILTNLLGELKNKLLMEEKNYKRGLLMEENKVYVSHPKNPERSETVTLGCDVKEQSTSHRKRPLKETF